MMTDLLNKDEIDALLSAITGGRHTPVSTPESPRVKLYDFIRPEKFKHGYMQQIKMIFDQFSGELNRKLPDTLRTSVHMSISSIDQLTYNEFTRSIASPTTILTCRIHPLPGEVVMEIDPCLSFCMIDRLSGGEGEQWRINRELTGLEQAILFDIVRDWAATLDRAFGALCPVKTVFTGIRTSARKIQTLPPDEMGLLAELKMITGPVHGMMNLFLPYPLLAPVLHRLSKDNPQTAPLTEHPGTQFTTQEYTAYYPNEIRSAGDIDGWKEGERLLCTEPMRTRKIYRIVPDEMEAEHES